MPSLDLVIQDICAGCAKTGLAVSEVLAAFIARTIIEANPAEYDPNVELRDEKVNNLVAESIKKLNERDSPSLETVKMQVEFDCSYVDLEEDLHRRSKGRQDQERDMQKAIVSILPSSGSDFDALTGLYRMIFAYVMNHFDSERDIGKEVPKQAVGVDPKQEAGNNDREVEREVAAALESVFPRIGLKAFVMLSPEQKRAQLSEMASIVLGIRLFNREVGKGGAGLVHVEEDAFTQAQELNEHLEHEIADVEDLCLQYQETIVYVQVTRPISVTPEEMKRWNDELANRRQYLCFLTALRDDVVSSFQKVGAMRNTFKSVVSDLQALVGARSSVPKEHVYPRFEQLAVEWLALVAESRVIKARQTALQVLHNTASSYHGTLAGDTTLTNAAKEASRGGYGFGFDPEDEGVLTNTTGWEGDMAGTKGFDPAVTTAAQSNSGNTSAGQDRGHSQDFKNNDYRGLGEAVLLTMDSTPDFMHLPLEFQGFCPWTIVQRNGLLLPGKPSEGVVRFDQRFYTFGHINALKSFMADPLRYVNGVMTAARESPELIHLLRLTDEFPDQSIKAIRGERASSPDPVNREVTFSSAGRSMGQNIGASREGGRRRVATPDQVDTPQQMKERIDVDSGVAVSKTSGPRSAQNTKVSEDSEQVDVQGKNETTARRRTRNGVDSRANEPNTEEFEEQSWEEEFEEPSTKDASTETPTHFVERNFDPSYEWNEWALRRRALQMTNIRNCSTTGAQTDLSHFRRENDSQVYLPKNKVTQTRKNSSTQPPLITQYAAGLRGSNAPMNLPSKYAVEKTGKPGVLNLVLEPGAKAGHVVVGGRSHAF